jgi:hypothetical protein
MAKRAEEKRKKVGRQGGGRYIYTGGGRFQALVWVRAFLG